MKKGVITIFLCYVGWGVLPFFWKLLSSTDSFYVLASRIIWSFVFSVGLIASFKAKDHFEEIKNAFKDTRTLIYMICASIFITINWGVYIWAISANHLVDCSLGYYISPIVVILLGFAVFKEKLNVLEWLSVALAAAGVIYSAIGTDVKVWIMLVESSSFAVYGVFKKKVKISAESGMVLETLFILPFAIAYIIFDEVTGRGGTVDISGAKYLLFIAAGVVTALPLLFYSKAVKLIPYSVAGVATYINPTIQFLLGALVYHEAISKSSIVTLVLIIAAVIVFVTGSLLKSRADKNRLKKAQAPAPEVKADLVKTE